MKSINYRQTPIRSPYPQKPTHEIRQSPSQSRSDRPIVRNRPMKSPNPPRQVDHIQQSWRTGGRNPPIRRHEPITPANSGKPAGELSISSGTYRPNRDVSEGRLVKSPGRRRPTGYNGYCPRNRPLKPPSFSRQADQTGLSSRTGRRNRRPSGTYRRNTSSPGDSARRGTHRPSKNTSARMCQRNDQVLRNPQRRSTSKKRGPREGPRTHLNWRLAC